MEIQSSSNKLQRKLGFWASLGGAVGLVVSGTAMVSLGAVGAEAGSATWLPALISLVPMLAVAAAYSELTAMFPGGGMISDYTMPVLGKFWSIMSILLGYILLISCDGGTQQIVGALALERMTGIPYIPIVVVMIILVLSVHLFGVQIYGRVQASLNVVMMGAFILIGCIGFFGLGESLGGSAPINELTPLQPETSWGAAMSCAGTAIWWYIGFEFICPMAEENKCPQKNIPKGLLIGLIIIFVADMLFVMGGVKYTDLEIMGSSSTPHIDIALAMCGQFGFIVITTVTVLAAFTSAVAHMAALPRMLYGMAHKKLAPKAFAYVHPKYRTPWVGIFFTAALFIITIIYMLFKGTDASVMIMLVNIACCTWLLSYSIAIIDVLIYRKKFPDFPRLFKVPFCIPVMVIALIGIAYCLWTMRYVWLVSGIAVAIFAIYSALWLKSKGMKLGEKESVSSLVKSIQERSEELPEWDEAVNAWMKEKDLA